jgi:hypothetical protein
MIRLIQAVDCRQASKGTGRVEMKKMTGMLSVIVFLALAATYAQEKAGAKLSDTTDEALLANERALQTAVAKGDKAAFQSLVLGSGIWATKIGFIPMNLLADGLDDFQLTKWEIVNPHVTRLDDNSAIVLYSWTGTGTFHNQPVAAITLASTVWTRRGGKWLAAHHQQTDLVRN